MSNELKHLDANQVLRSVYDIANNCLRVCVIGSDAPGGGSGALEVIISHTDDSIRLGDGVKLVTATQIGGLVGLDVHLINSDIDIRDLSHLQDSVTIGDPDDDILDIQPDGSIIVKPGVNTNLSGLKKYNEVTAVANGVETVVVTHTAIVGRTTYLQKVYVSGDNMAKYRVKLNGTTIETARTYFGGEIDREIPFDGDKNPGLPLTVGDIVTVTVEHDRPDSADFNGRIQYLEVI